MNFPQLNLPAIEANIKIDADQEYIFDGIRKKYLVLTPEEWVRQHFIHLLINHLGYPAGLFQIERGHSYSGKAKRTDILVYNNMGSPHLLVECKAPNVGINFVWEFKKNEYIQLKDFPRYTT